MFKHMSTNSVAGWYLASHKEANYNALRLVLASMIMLFPMVLWLGGVVLFDIELQGSISQYYHATSGDREAWRYGAGDMRDVYMAFLASCSVLFVLYKGFTSCENWALNGAGFFLALTAFNPISCCAGGEGSDFWHLATAVMSFVCVFYVCFFRASDTLFMVRDQRRRKYYEGFYRGIGLLIGLLVIGSLVLKMAGYEHVVFAAETIGVFIFAFYWIAKTFEIKETRAEILRHHAEHEQGTFRIVEPCPLFGRAVVEEG